MNSVLIEWAQWAVTSSVLAAVAQAGLWLTRTKDPRTRLSIWTTVLFAALLMPPVRWLAFTRHFTVSISILSAAPDSLKPSLPDTTLISAARQAVLAHGAPVVFVWTVGALYFLARIAIGLVLAARVARKSTLVQKGVRQSDLVATPVTTGWLSPVVLLPANWLSWDPRKLTAVLAHERSHVCRRDPLVRLAGAVFRSITWFNPLSWWLSAELSRLMEILSDEAALMAVRDQVFYAEIVVGFFRTESDRRWSGAVEIAGAHSRARRIDRILNADPGCPQTPPARFFFLLRPTLVAAALVGSLPCADATAPLSDAPAIDLSGTWRLNVSRSVFRNPAPPSECFLKIQQTRSRIEVVFDFVKPNGRARHQALNAPTPRTLDQPATGGREIHGSALWGGKSIVIFEKLPTIASERVLSTSADRRTLKCQTTYHFAGRTVTDSEVYDRLQ